MAGDGTTTATVLRCIYEEGQKLVAVGNNPMGEVKLHIDYLRNLTLVGVAIRLKLF